MKNSPTLSLNDFPDSDTVSDASSRRGWITWRSVLLGSIGAAILCALVPYNDYVVANTFMVGSYIPPAVVLLLLTLAVFNAILHRWAKTLALSRGEMGTVLAMLLAACSIPSQGLMRSFLPNMVWPFHFGQSDARLWAEFSGMNLPGWLFPTGRATGDPHDPVIDYFYTHIPAGSGTPIPYHAWVTPILAWGVFFGAMLTTLVALAVLVLPQWALNERLPFPLAQVQLSLIEPPASGKIFNHMLGSWLFWAALGAVLLVHSLWALSQYFPKVPTIPFGYDLNGVFSTDPWWYLSGYIKKNQIYFTFVGVAFFVQSRMSFSLWAIFIIQQLLGVWLHTLQVESVAQGAMDQHIGACVAYVAGAIWIGRLHWVRVIRSAIGGRSLPAEFERFAPARLALLVAIVGISGMGGWMIFLGVKPLVAALVIAFILLGHAVTARLVAETGLPYFRAMVSSLHISRNLPIGWFSTRDVYFSGVFDTNGPYLARESAMVFTQLGLRDNDSPDLPPRQGRRLLMLMVWAMILGFGVSAWSSLHYYYTYDQPLSARLQIGKINPWAVDGQPRRDVIPPLMQHADGRWPPQPYNPWVHLGAGALITAVLQVGSLRWAGWPLMPVGFVASQSYYVQQAWFSLFLGWLAKVIILRYGGTKFYSRARPVFIGMICGECISAGLWLVINLILASNGYDYRPMNFLPT